MTHVAFDYRPDHDFIAAQIEADLAAEAAGVVLSGPRTTHSTTAPTDIR